MKKSSNSIKMSDYIKINKPNYSYLRLIPSTSIKNNKASDIVEVINKTYKDIDKRFKKYNKGFSYDVPSKVSFVIDIDKDNASFYIIVPDIHEKEFYQKLTEIYGKITIEKVESMPKVRKDCTKYSLSSARDDSLSLAVDKRDNDLLSANLSIMDILKDDDRVVIYYNFIPQSKMQLAAWKNYHVNKMKEYQQGVCLDKTFTMNKAITIISNFMFMSLDMLTTSVIWMFGEKEKNDNSLKRLIPVQELTSASKRKENAEVVSTEIMIMSQSIDKNRESENAKTLINTFATVGDGADNKLMANKIIDKKSKSIGIKKKKYNNQPETIEYIDFDKLSNEECVRSKFSEHEVGANMIALAGKTLIEEYGLEATQHTETNVPEELTEGTIRYGANTFRGKDTTVTISSDDDAACMPELIMAKMGGGKTSAFENKGVDAVNNNDGLIVLDYVKNCEMSDNIMRNIIDKTKIVEVNLADYFCQEGFSFNEINMIRNMDSAISRYECAILQNAQITNFIDTLGDEEFSASMGRYLDAACTAVLIHENKNLKDIVKCLEDYASRKYYMDYLNEFNKEMPDEYRELIYEDLTALEELNEYRDTKDSKGKKTGDRELSGTNISKISGIISRISMLKKNPALKFMYIRSPKNNINLAQMMQEGKAIFFKMPQNRFSSPQVKNIMVSYLFSKIMIASEIRSEIYKNEKLRTVHVICDEIQQARGSFTNIGEMCYQMRKFRVKLILSTHNFKKIEPIKDIMIDAGASIMMLKGSSVKDFEVLKDEFSKFGFTKEDLVALSHTDKYKALCLIATKKGRHGCIITLPKPVKNKIELQNVTEVDFKQKQKVS